MNYISYTLLKLLFHISKNYFFETVGWKLVRQSGDDGRELKRLFYMQDKGSRLNRGPRDGENCPEDDAGS